MARTKFKWKLAIFSYLILVNVFTKSLPIETKLPSLIMTDTVFKNAEIPESILTSHIAVIQDEELSTEEIPTIDNSTETIENNHTDIILNATRNTLLRQDIRPGQKIREYAIEITPNGNTFTGRAVLTVELTFATREDNIELHCEDLDIQSVMAGVFSEANAIPVEYFGVDEGILEITTGQVASSYILIIDYSGSLTTAGQGLYQGQFNDFTYLAMNLHPTNARRVFPCMDEPTESAMISFTYNNIEYNHIVSNSIREENDLIQFRAVEGPPHLWSMAAHSFNNINLPTNNVLLYIRPGVTQQDAQASVAFNFYFNNLNEWADRSYFDIQMDQNPQLSILALPDTSVDWYGLSTIGIWEPYVLMENACSVKQRYIGLVKMAEALARQWFGYVVYPENWQHEWVVSGLGSYAAWDILREFQIDPTGIDTSLLDIHTLFVTEIMQESLYHDAYLNAQVLELGEDIFEEHDIRYNNNNGIMKYKAPALLRMMRLVLGDESQDFIQSAGRALLSGRALQSINSFRLVDAINGEWSRTGNGIVEDIEDYIRPWIENNGYPLVHVGLRQGGVLVTQERFSFSTQPYIPFEIPITYSISTNPNFDVIHPANKDNMLDGTMTLNMFLDPEEGDYVLFNNQGQGYYRVNYDDRLWETIIEALQDPDRRAEIHPLNRATLIDDSLNLARAGLIDYETPFEVVLAMEHETEYAPWKAFIRNMNFLRRRLVALVEEDEDLDPDIYLRMVRRAIVSFEREVGFTPDITLIEPAMVSLTRGLVMDHACRANYQPCIAAAVDWFWDPNNNEIVNPNIPADLRPAVFCTMVREGDEDIITALHARLEIEVSMYERVVILESLACSRDDGYIRTYLEETLATNSPYTPEEGLSIFKAVAAASYQNAWLALNFIISRTDEIRSRYGGHAKLEEAIHALSINMADGGQSNDFNIWVYSSNNRLGESEEPARKMASILMEDQAWEDRHLEYIYEWIDENDAPKLIVSSVLIFASCLFALFNH